MKVKTQRLVAALVAALATAVVLVSGAQADRPDNRAGVLGVGAVSRTASAPDWFERAVARSTAPIVRPDDRAGVIGVGGVTPAIVASTRPARPEEGVGIRGARPVATSLVPAVSGDSSGFDWANVSMAVGFVLATSLLAAAATLAARHRRHITLP
jgi:hypothetical protein